MKKLIAAGAALLALTLTGCGSTDIETIEKNGKIFQACEEAGAHAWTNYFGDVSCSFDSDYND